MPDKKEPIKGGLKEIAEELKPNRELTPPSTSEPTPPSRPPPPPPRIKLALCLVGAAVLGVVIGLVVSNGSESNDATVTSTVSNQESGESTSATPAPAVTTTTTSTVTVTAPPADASSDEGADASP